jgi:hypothetical protein
MDWDDGEFRVSEVTTYSVVANIGTYGRTFIIQSAKADKGELADSGANCCMTTNINLLSNIRQLKNPITIGLAVSNDGIVSSTSECTHIGDLSIKCDNGETFSTKCFYNPNASDTIISPQAVIDGSDEFVAWNQRGRKFGQPGQLNFVGPKGTKSITLQQHNGLYFISSTTYNIVDDNADIELDQPIPSCGEFTANKMETTSTQTNISHRPKKLAPRAKRFTPTTQSKVLEAETWYLRMGGCNEDQLDKLTQHAVGIPSKFEWHPFRFVDFKEQARVWKQPMGQDPNKVAERGRRFYMDYGFVRASNEDFDRPTKKKDRVIELFDGYSSYLFLDEDEGPSN